MKATDRFSGGGSGMIWPLVSTLVILFLGAAASLAQAPADKVIVADVLPQFIPQGNQSVSSQKVMSLIKTRAGMEYQAMAVNEDVRRLWDTKQFADIRVVIKPTEDKKVIVIFQLKELPGVIQEIQYLGANHMKKEDLDALSGLKAGLPLNPWATQKARQAIIAKYHEKGRLSASVDVLEGDKVGDSRVVFNIAEGPVAKVGGLDFVGNTFVSGPRLRTQVNSSRPFLGIIGGDFNPLMADNDITKLEEYYKSHGFHDVQVKRELKWDGSQQYVRLVFHIHEGQRYRVAGIDITGVSSKEREELLPLIKHVKAGEIYSQSKMEADRNRLVDWKGYQGQQTVVQEALYYPPDKPGQMVLNYEVSERPAARVAQVIITGNDVTKDNVIRRQLNLFPGQVLTYPDLRLAERNLARLNIFELKPEMGIRPTVTVLDDQDGEFKDILVNVQETQTGSLLFGVGVNSDAGVNGTIVLNERNFDIMRPPTSLEDLLSGRAFRGGGQEFRIEAVPGNQLQRYSVTFREPFLFDSPYSFSIGAYYYNRIFNEYQEARVGSRITFGRQINKLWSANVGLRVEGVGVHDVSSFAPADYQNVTGKNFLLGLKAGVTRDSRDSYLRATEGSLLDFSFEECLGDFTFPVINLEANKYWTTYQRPDASGKHVLALHSQLSWAGANAPVYERFFAGGFRSMRGFEFRGVGPDINGFKVGGDFMFLNSLEYQVPIFANDNLYAVAFVDSGTVERRVSLDTYRVSAGAGLRIVVPMLGPVPIALDFGFPIVKAPEDRDQVFSFWVGFFK